MSALDGVNGGSARLSSLRQVVAIVGCQRSGTTLPGQILGGQPGALLLDEPDGVYGWIRGGGPDPVLDHDLLLRAAAKYREPETRVSTAGRHAVLASGVDTLVLKTPNLTYEEALLSTLAVPVTVIYPFRDPRAVAASMARLGHIDFLGNQLRLLQAQPEALKAGYAAELALMADPSQSDWTRRGVVWRVKTGRPEAFRKAGLRVLAFAYERLVGEPSAAIAELCQACGFDAGRRLQSVYGVYRGEGPDGADRTREVDGASLERWRDRLAPRALQEIMAAAAPLALALGYD